MEYKELLVIIEEFAEEQQPETVTNGEKRQEANKKGVNRKFICVLLSAVLLLGVGICAVAYGSLLMRYHKAIELMEGNEFARAKAQFEALGNFKDAPEMIGEAEKSKSADKIPKKRL